MDQSQWWQTLHANTVTVVGLGVSNLPLIDFLLSHGVTVTARDQKDRSALGTTLDELTSRGVKLFLGTDYLKNLTERVIFRSPGLRPDLPEFVRAVESGAILTSEMELFFELSPATLIGITGSDGKTTTTTLTHLMLAEECRRRGISRAFVGGNIGEPLLPRVESMTPDDFAVVELSSFQLQTMHRSANRAALTNLSPNHLNWHLGMDEYINAKTNLFRHAQNRLLITNAENDITRTLAKEHNGKVTWFSSVKSSPRDFFTLLRPGDAAIYCQDGIITLWDQKNEIPLLDASLIRLPGRHNLENYMTAIALLEGLISRESIEAVAKSFTGVRHRLEPVRVLDGVTYYNSSIDSSPTRTAAALSALEQKPIVICGGKNKGLDLAPLASALSDRAKAVILTGEAAPAILEALNAEPSVQKKNLPIKVVPLFAEAVSSARAMAMPGDTVLLSPACTSFDAFRNFEERGDTFCSIVNQFQSK